MYNTLDSDSIVLEKCTFVHEKSLKSPWIPFLKKCGNHACCYWFPERKNDLSVILVKIDSGNDCVPSGTKPLP